QSTYFPLAAHISNKTRILKIKPMILEMGLKWQQISLSAEDAQFLETRKFQLEEICRIFRVPLHMVQNTDRATFNNIENLGIGFINYSLVPYLIRIEQR
ncbi:phage portal protein, partial [Escherichia coli]|uniref:phage portal protein n=1 Tax=Escherichia coli TaxID=562 RepID=UPI003CE7A919